MNNRREKAMVLILAKSDIERVLSMRKAIEVIEKAFAELALGTAHVPLRSKISMEQYKGTLLVMPAYLAESKSLAVKTVTIFDQNPVRYGLPTIMATVILNDPLTGKPLAIMDGAFLTAARTGAASGVATKYLARPNSRTVGIIGAGVQARTQLSAVLEVRDIEKAFVYDVIAERTKEYAMEMSRKLGIDVLRVNDPKEAVAGVDIVIIATTAMKPVIKGAWIDQGTHINSIGWTGVTSRELDTETVRRSKLVVDSRDSALSESGDILIPLKEGAITKDHIYSELGEIIVGRKKGRISDEEITLWKSVGLAVQDAAAAKLAYEQAIEAKLGVELELV